MRQRSTWTTETIRVTDLDATDTVLVDGIWREILDVWQPGGNDPAWQFGDNHPTTTAILDKVEWGSPCWMAVRWVDEDQSTDDELVDALHFFRLRDLVRVQKEVPPVTTAAGPAFRGRKRKQKRGR